MEAVAAARHAELLSTLNAHLAQLSQQVEAAVQQGLPVRLQPVDLSLQPPDASQFHADLDQLLSRGLVETREKHLRVSQREVVERVRRHGICRCAWQRKRWPPWRRAGRVCLLCVTERGSEQGKTVRVGWRGAQCVRAGGATTGRACRACAPWWRPTPPRCTSSCRRRSRSSSSAW